MLRNASHRSEEPISDDLLFGKADSTVLNLGIVLGRVSQQEPTQGTLEALQAVAWAIESEFPFGQVRLSRKQKTYVTEVQSSLREFLDDFAADSQSNLVDSLVESARSDYLRLMVGVGDPLAAPWESVYLSKERSIFQASTLDVRRWFHNYGLQSALEYREPDDHIGLIIEFACSVLVGDLASAIPSKTGESPACMAQFIREHLTSWVEEWNDCVQKHAQTSYCKALGWGIVATTWYLRGLLES